MEGHLKLTSRIVVGGIDAHSNTHHVAALDSSGRRLGSQEFPASTRGYQDALDWLGHFGVTDKIGIESTGSYAAGITTFLLARGDECSLRTGSGRAEDHDRCCRIHPDPAGQPGLLDSLPHPCATSTPRSAHHSTC